MAQFMSAGYPVELVAAKKADRIAWISNDKGLRNVFTASAPGFRAIRVTSFMNDDGVDISDVELSDDGSIAVFVSGSAPNQGLMFARLRGFEERTTKDAGLEPTRRENFDRSSSITS